MKKYALVLGLVFFLNACLSWQPGFDRKFIENTDPVAGSADQISDQYHQLLKTANSAQDLDQLLKLLEAKLKGAPDDIGTMTTIAVLLLLKGDAYASSSSQKEKLFITALQYSEAAMYTNPEFRVLVDKGVPVWEASRVLGKNEIDAMGFWVTSVFYYFRHVAGPVTRMFNVKWVERARTVMEAIDKIDPAWGRGSLYATWGLYYLAAPEIAGGDKKLAEEYFIKSIEAGPDMMLNRWIRARYYFQVIGDRGGFKTDLEWIIQQDPLTGGPYPVWSRFIQKDSQEMLQNIDSFF